MRHFYLKKMFNKHFSIRFIVSVMALLMLFPSLSQGINRSKHSNSEIAEDINMPNNLRPEISKLAKSDKLKWLCYYGSDHAVLELPSYNLLVLEGDALGSIAKKPESIRVAYLSIGEISPDRWYWEKIKNKPWVLEKNRDWADAARVDPRSQEWSDMLVNTIAPRLLAMGYDGFMLDNIDTGEYLEQKDPKAYAGAKTAMADIIRRLRAAYPHAVFIGNGGLDTAAEAAESLDAVIRESIFSRWISNPNGSISYVNVSPQDRAWLRPRLDRVRAAGLPVLDLEYVDSRDREACERVLHEAKKAGYFPYIAQRNLMHLPETQ